MDSTANGELAMKNWSMNMCRKIALAMMLLLGSTLWAQQNPHLKVNINDYTLGIGTGGGTCYDGSSGTGNQCLAKWLAGSVYVINDANTGFDCTTAYPGSWCILYFSSVPYLSNLYWVRDAVGASKYEQAILHYYQTAAGQGGDTGGLHASALIGMDQFDWFAQINAFTEGFAYYRPNEAQNGVLLYDNLGRIYTDITGLSYGAAITTVSYNSGTFTLTGIARENFTNIGAGQVITLAGFTNATFLNGKTATVLTSTGTSSPVMTFNFPCSANCTGSNETGYIAVPQVIPNNQTMYIGYMEPFDQINVRIASPRSGGSVSYEYSKGGTSWGDLTTAPHWSDGTAGLTSGLASAQISFYPPSDWAPAVVRGTRAKFWVRITVNSASATIFNLRADNLLSAYNNTGQCGTVVQAQTGHSCLLRGWSESAYQASTACGGAPCLVAGAYKYNPSPPSSASGRFIYQTRSGLYGGYGNETWLNPSTLDTDGKTLAGKVLAYLWAADKAAVGVAANGTMFDNAATTNYGYGAAWNAGNNTDLACAPSCTDTLASSNFETYWGTALGETTAAMHAAYSPFFVTGNLYVTHPTSTELATAPFSTGGTMARVGPGLDLALVEASGNATSPGYFNSYPQTAENQYNVASGFQISNATSDHIYQYGFCDIISQTVPCLPTVWNRGIQGSMATLVQQYMFANANGNTSVVYTPTSEASYTMGDQYYYFQDATTLTAAIASGLHTTSPAFTFAVASTTPLTAMTGSTNPFAGATIVRICPAVPGSCENGDIFQVSTTAPHTVTPNSNVTQNSINYVGIANNYTGTEKVQIMSWGHAAITLTGNMPPWQSMGLYGTLAPAYRVDIGVPDSTIGWQPPNGNCLYSVNHNTYPPPATACSKGDPDLFYSGSGANAFKQSAYAWSGLPCDSNGHYTSPHGTANMDCSPLALRSYTNGLVLLRTFRTGGTLPTAPEELVTPSKPIDLSNMSPTCASTCTYQRVYPDGSLGAAINTISLKGAEGAVLKGPVSGGGLLTITGPSSCPNGYQGSVYAGCFPAATGGTPPYTWSISAGSLCSGLSQDTSTGAITGTPLAHGACSFTVRVTDFVLHFATQLYSPTIFWPMLTITTTTCPDGTIGVAYAGCALGYTGGNMSNTWSLVPPGHLPPGLTLNSSTGIIAGTPTGSSGTFFFTAGVADTETPPQTAQQPLRINVGSLLPLTGLYGSASLTGSASLK